MTNRSEIPEKVGNAIAYLLALVVLPIMLLAAAVIIQALWRVMFR